MAMNGKEVHQNGHAISAVKDCNASPLFSGPPRYAPAMYAIPIEQPVVSLDAKTAFQVILGYLHGNTLVGGDGFLY